MKTVDVSRAPSLDLKTSTVCQNVDDAGRGMGALHARRCYGLVTGGPDINIERSRELSERGRHVGTLSSADGIGPSVGELAGRRCPCG